MQTMLQATKQPYNSPIIKLKHDSTSDGCGNLTTNHPALRAKIEEDAKRFRIITDLRTRGIIK